MTHDYDPCLNMMWFYIRYKINMYSTHSNLTVSLTHFSVTSLPPSTTLSHTSASQSLVMSPGGVASDGSVTLTLADAQGMLDGVTLNLNAQVIQHTWINGRHTRTFRLVNFECSLVKKDQIWMAREEFNTWKSKVPPPVLIVLKILLSTRAKIKWIINCVYLIFVILCINIM